MIFTYGYLFYIPITILFAIPLLLIGILKKRPISYYFMSCIFIVYLNFAINIAFFPIIIQDIPEFDIAYNVKWTLTFAEANKKQTFLNVLLTVPIGIGLQFILNLKFKMRLIISILGGMSFEVFQLFILFIWKPINIIFDMDDLVCNIVGALVGFMLISVFNLCFKQSARSEKKGIFSYIKNVCRNCANGKSSLEF